LAYEPVTPSPVVLADPWHVGQILHDLVDDAIRYTEEGGRVVVSTGRIEEEGRKWATVTVSDTGEMIPVEDLMHIFERFSRKEEPQSVRAFDTGLRLMTMRETVALHGGRVAVESGEVEGVTFTIWLPLAG
jgi:signal transduction histidine kinase